MKRTLTLALCLLMVLSAFAGGSKDNTAKSSSSTSAASTSVEKIEEASLSTVSSESVVVDKVSIALGYDLSGLEPWGSATAGRNTVMQMVYEFMGYYDPTTDSGVAGILMKDFKRGEDGFTARATIYDYIYDSAGNHLTAEDVAFCFNTWKANGKSVKCKVLDSVSVIDDYTVEFKLANNTVGDLENMLCGLVPIVTRKAYEDAQFGMITDPVSTSPYKVKEFVSGSSLLLEKRDDYWQTDESLIQPVSKANAKQIEYKIITESFQVPIALETNTIDITSQLSYNDASKFMNDPALKEKYNVYGVKDTNFYWITFNCDKGAVFEDNLALRQAVAYAIDAAGLVTGVLHGGGEVTHAYANNLCVDYNTEWDNEPYYEYDLAKAKELLKESGFDTSKTLTLMTTSGTVPKNAAQIIQVYLQQLGLKVELAVYESALYQQYRTDPSQWDIMLDAKLSNDYVTSLASTFEVSGNARALNFVEDEKLQSMVKNVVTVTGHTAENIEEYMDYIRDQCYVYSFFIPYQYYVVEKGIDGIFINFKSYLIPSACTYTAEFVN